MRIWVISAFGVTPSAQERPHVARRPLALHGICRNRYRWFRAYGDPMVVRHDHSFLGFGLRQSGGLPLELYELHQQFITLRRHEFLISVGELRSNPVNE